MTQIPAGWYPDPDPSVPHERRGQRYWDGSSWTEHVLAPSGPVVQGGYPGAPYTGTPYPAAPAYGQGYGAAPSAAVATTPDGERLAGWWQRVAAYLIDLLVMTPVVFLLAWPWMSDILSIYTDMIGETMEAARAGTEPPDQAEIFGQILVPMLMVTLVGLAVNLVYNAGFLKWRAATPGKMVVGLKVRLREKPGPLSWGTVLLRWGGQNWHGLASGLPILGSVVSLWPVIDSLWPLWDDKKQALHDKIARTNVVRTR